MLRTAELRFDGSLEDRHQRRTAIYYLPRAHGTSFSCSVLSTTLPSRSSLENFGSLIPDVGRNFLRFAKHVVAIGRHQRSLFNDYLAVYDYVGNV